MRRTFYRRTFSKMGKGSLRGSVFALCASAIGSGVLSLPYVLKLNGWGLGLFFIGVGALAAQWSNKILARLAVEHDVPNLSQLALRAGGPALAKALAGMVFTYVLGGCISYQIIIASLGRYVCLKFGMDPDLANSVQLRVYFTVGAAVALLFPLAMKRDMSAFRYVSLASIGALFYTGIVLIVELPEYYREFGRGVPKPLYRIDFNIFTGSAMTFFAYTC